jgi:hypothetical protein
MTRCVSSTGAALVTVFAVLGLLIILCLLTSF